MSIYLDAKRSNFDLSWYTRIYLFVFRMISGHDGNVILWDLLKGTMLKSFFNLVSRQTMIKVLTLKIACPNCSIAQLYNCSIATQLARRI